MLVTVDNIHILLEDLEKEKLIGFDTETYGLNFHDRLFSLSIATEKTSYYLNFNAGEDHLGYKASTVLHYSLLGELLPYTDTLDKIWVAHNASFDIQKLANEGLYPPRRVHCTMITERLIRNDTLSLSLENIAMKYGLAKDMRVDAYIEKHKLYSQAIIPGKNRKEKILHFDKVPFNLMVEYGEHDAVLARQIGKIQLARHVKGIL